MQLFKEATSKFTPEQMIQFYNNAKQFGIPEEVINKVKGIDAK